MGAGNPGFLIVREPLRFGKIERRAAQAAAEEQSAARRSLLWEMRAGTGSAPPDTACRYEKFSWIGSMSFILLYL